MSIINYSDLIGEDKSFQDIFQRISELEQFVLKTKSNISGKLDVVSPADSKQVEKLALEIEKLKKSEQDLNAVIKNTLKAKEDSVKLSKKEQIALRDKRIELEKTRGAEKRATLEKKAELDKIKQAEKNLLAQQKKAESTKRKTIQLTRAEKIALEEKRIEKQKETAQIKSIIKLRKSQKNSIESLRAKLSLVTVAWTKLTAEEIKNTNRGKRLAESKRKLTLEIKSLERATESHGRNVGNYTKAYSKLGSVLGGLGIGLGVAGIFRGLSGGKDILVEYDEALADLQKTANITKVEAVDIATSLNEIDTRTTTNDLIALASAGGRLGLRGDDIVDFTEQIDKAFVSLGDSLSGTPEEIGLTLGKIASTFGVEKDFGIGEGINKIGSSLNELGANSKATEGNIVDFTNRLAGIASQADISAPDIQALGALFDESGQSIEVSASTIGKLLPELGKDIEKFSSIAGMGMEEFKELVEKDAFEALIKVSEGAKSSEGGLIGLTEVLENYGITSARAGGIVGVLSSKTDRLRELQEISNKAFDEGTSITDEFNKKNNTLGASFEKLTKEFKKYITSASDSVGANDKLIAGVNFLKNNLSRILDIVIKAVKIFATYKTIMFGIEKAQKLAALATALYTKVTTKATTVTKLFNKATKANIIGLIITLLYAAYEAFTFFSAGAEESAKNQNKLNDALLEFNDITEKSLSLEERFANLSSLNNRQRKALKDDIKEQINLIEDLSVDLEKNIGQILSQNEEYQKLQYTLVGLTREQKNNLSLTDSRYNAAQRSIEIENQASKSVTSSIFTLANLSKMYDSITFKKENQNKLTSKEIGLINKQSKVVSDLQKNIRKATSEKQIISLTIELDKAKEELKRLNNLYRFSTEERIKIETDLITDQTRKSIELEKQKSAKVIEQIETNSAISTEKKKILIEKENAILQNTIDSLELVEEERVFKIKYEYEQSVTKLDLDRVEREIQDVEKLISKSTSLNNTDEFNRLNELETKKYDLKKKALEDQYNLELEFQKKKADLELDLLEKGSQDYIDKQNENTQERLKIENEKVAALENINKEYTDKIIDLEAKQKADKIESWKAFYEEYKNVITLVVDKLVEVYEKQLALSKENSTKQATEVEKQRQRAEDGKSNTLLFEQKELAKREKQIIASEKRLERIRKAKALYASYNANLSKEGATSGEALAKALRDFGIIEAISKGFKLGGYTGDGGVNDVAGVTHGKEFVIDAKGTSELGLKGKNMSYFRDKIINKSNPYTGTKGIALTGLKLAEQKEKFIKETGDVRVLGMNELKNEMRELKEWQMSIPIQKVDVKKITDNILDFVSEVREGNMTERETYRVNKKRF